MMCWVRLTVILYGTLALTLTRHIFFPKQLISRSSRLGDLFVGNIGFIFWVICPASRAGVVGYICSRTMISTGHDQTLLHVVSRVSLDMMRRPLGETWIYRLSCLYNYQEVCYRGGG